MTVQTHEVLEFEGPRRKLRLSTFGLAVLQPIREKGRLYRSQGLQNHFAREFRQILDMTRSIPDDREVTLDR